MQGLRRADAGGCAALRQVRKGHERALHAHHGSGPRAAAAVRSSQDQPMMQYPTPDAEELFATFEQVLSVMRALLTVERSFESDATA